jgi:hypothetical protein
MTAEEADELRRTVESNGTDRPDGTEEEEESPECNIRDLEGATMSNADFLLNTVYGDHVHQNSSHHLDGDASNEIEWQSHWRRLAVYPSQTYDAPPKGKVGRRFVEKVAELLESIQKHGINHRSS